MRDRERLSSLHSLNSLNRYGEFVVKTNPNSNHWCHSRPISRGSDLSEDSSDIDAFFLIKHKLCISIQLFRFRSV